MEEKTKFQFFKRKPFKCPNCGRELQYGDDSCPFCGQNLKLQAFVRRHTKLLLVLALLIGLGILNYRTIELHVKMQYYRWASKNDSKQLPDYEIEYYRIPGEEQVTMYLLDSRWDAFYKTIPEEDAELIKDAASLLDDAMVLSLSSYLEEMAEIGYEEKDAMRAVEAFHMDWNHEARKAMNDFLPYGGFSRTKAKKRLLDRGFTEEQAEYAVSTCGADWGKQARIYTQELLEYITMSYPEAEESMRREGFEKDEISWALENMEVDWNLMAYLRGKEYLRLNIADREELSRKLKKDGFTQEQADYAAQKLHGR